MRPFILAITVAILQFIVLSASGQNNAAPPAPKPKNDEFVMKSGSILGFRQINMSMGEVGFEVMVTCADKTGAGRLEFRIDHARGKKIGTLDIPYTADTVYSAKLVGHLPHANGVHDLYLIARGSSEFSISAFGFIRNYWYK
ncbi:carbohydrate-binding protein [Chitinophaga sedimenti]|uniref:carbohydrate-binding protein n=1 Tax=Chitinophaga sedimenti TaxID=2033606 RepID=UPI0020068DB7|nr:carbohydrate-binding protein [Chitinophaga sedimenti]MCK7556612.1 carbohydrate-binding protein [Chitinophaga sedimenti]